MKGPFQKSFFYQLAAIFVLCLSVSLIYSNTMHVPFVFDDTFSIKDNRYIRVTKLDYKQLRDVWSFGPTARRPLAAVSLSLNYYFSHDDVTGYHLFNIFIHLVNGILVYYLARIVLGRLHARSRPINHLTAIFAALIFVVHPIQTQAVTYIIQRYTSMAAMFYLASVLFYIKGRIRIQGDRRYGPRGERHARDASESISDGEGGLKRATDANRGERRGIWRFFGFRTLAYFAVSILCGLSAFLCKQTAATLPGVILLVEYLLFDRSWQGWMKKLVWLVPIFACFALFVLYISGFFRSGFQVEHLLTDISEMTRTPRNPVGRWDYLCTQFNVMVIYIRLLFLPTGQSIDYMYPFKNGFFDGHTPYAFLLLMGIIGFGILSRNKRPVVTFAVFWFFISLSIESSIFPIRDALFEHRLYLPMFAFALLVAHILCSLLVKRRLWLPAVPLTVILALGAATYNRNRVWQDRISLWSDAVSKKPHNYRAYYNLGAALQANGKAHEAIEYFSEALQIKPNYVEAHCSMGIVLARQGSMEEAIDHFSKALRLAPTYAKAHSEMGVTLARQGDLMNAMAHFREAIRLKPSYADAHDNLAIALMQQGKVKEAIKHFSKAIDAEPDHAKAHFDFGNVLVRQGRIGEAIDHFSEAIRIDPDYAAAHCNLGIALARQGRTGEAMDHFSEAIRIKPDYEKPRRYLRLLQKKASGPYR